MSDQTLRTAPGQSPPSTVPSLPSFEFLVAYCLARKQRDKPQTEVFITNKRILIRQVGGDLVDEIPLRSVTTARPYRYLNIPLGPKRFVYVALSSKDPFGRAERRMIPVNDREVEDWLATVIRETVSRYT